MLRNLCVLQNDIPITELMSLKISYISPCLNCFGYYLSSVCIKITATLSENYRLENYRLLITNLYLDTLLRRKCCENIESLF